MHITALYRYPVKGLQGQSLEETRLEPGFGIRGDRRFALAKPSYDAVWGADQNHIWGRKSLLICGADDPAATAFTAHLDTQTDRPVACGANGQAFDLGTAAGLNDFAQAIGFDNPLRLLDSGPQGLGFSDQISPFVSLANVATAQWLAERMGVNEHPIFGLHPGRFKNNIWLAGLPPWAELSWLQNRALIQVGDAWLRVHCSVGRCANIDANPNLGQRDIPLLKTLLAVAKDLGHRDSVRGSIDPTFGVFASVVSPGSLHVTYA